MVALSKVNGTYLEQYRLAGGSVGWTDLRAWYVEQGLEGAPDAIVWISQTGVHRVPLEASTSAPASPGPSPGASPAATAAAALGR